MIKKILKSATIHKFFDSESFQSYYVAYDDKTHEEIAKSYYENEVETVCEEKDYVLAYAYQ